ncbi:MAG: peptidase U32 family protein [Motiliproteus sp.]
MNMTPVAPDSLSHPIKLMGPGGSRDMALATLEAGADSVFIGPKGWSRRPKSDELTDAEMFEVIDYGLAEDKDIRVAINVMPAPDEISLFMRKIEQFAKRGAQGVMLCDPGCIRMVREQFPELEIHVSVTAGLFNREDIQMYRELGANIVVIPYRWGSEEIAQIRDQSGVQLEAFLFQPPKRSWICPGRCYSSSYFHIAHKHDAEDKNHFIGSASRGGSCHRICRIDWQMMKGSTKLDEELFAQRQNLKASPELLLWELPEYLRLGVSRLKIPGRERSISLVVEIVGFYRRVLDHLLAGGQCLDAYEDEWKALKYRWEHEKKKRDNNLINLAMTG